MARRASAVLQTGLGVLWLAASATPASGAPPLTGYRLESAAAQRSVEARFDANLSASEILTRLQLMSSAPNHIGSAHNKLNAEFTQRELKKWGWDAKIESFDVLYPVPDELSLELVAPEGFRATLREPPVPGDPTSTITQDVLPAYAVYGGDGDVTAPLVYVNYGLAGDYDALLRMGVSVKGKIVIARFGGGWRGLKPKLAYEHGAVGCILYSDPAEDGYGAGDVYPAGAWRPAHGVQRGSVLDLPVAPGDPLTPVAGEGATGERLTPDLAPTIMKIPVLPISYADAQPFLAALGGQAVPRTWQGALPITYHVGPGPAQAHMVVHSRWTTTALYNVIATMKGSRWPDEWVIRGNNRDAWVYGAWDSLSGHSVMLEEARAIGALRKAGWRPKRTIIYASWDGEEAGLLGSVEWAKRHGSELRAHAALYVNSGPYARGLMEASASYSTKRLINEVAADVRDPESQVSVRDRAFSAFQVQSFESGLLEAGELSAARRSAGDMPVGDMGAGSDYAAFLQHLGIASIDLGYGGEGAEAATAHSIYDSFEHFRRFGDPTGAYGVTFGQIAGRLVLRTADADILPMHFTESADRIGEVVAELHALTMSMRQRAKDHNDLLAQGAFARAADPSKVSAAREPQEAVPLIDLTPLDDAAATLKRSARNYDAAVEAVPRLPPERQARLNSVLRRAEQAFIDPRGLPGRPWYRHLIYEPGLRTGYEAKTLPGVREAIEGHRWQEAAEYIRRTARVIQDHARNIDQATLLLKP